ncbi:EAL domain-containing protein [Pseudomonas benzenivorans]|uniref:EAL domain-containing protein n=1 Tax=Pseudomonas benzenivorans TaxID=556533 RepID=A0ABZ0PRY5_9PSED|nr:EAL domain-containing protein [Pseudomonas benzenivorans]WPC03871.1 EAL domain-containing protein [Pseudomonas benzenivorans]
MAAVQLRAIRAPLPAAELDSFVKLTALACQMPIVMLIFPVQDSDGCGALLGMADGERYWQGALSAAITAAQERVQVADASTNEQLRHCDLVAGPPYIKCFASVPIALAGRDPAGVLAVADTLSKALDASQLEALELLARQITASIEQRSDLRELADRLTRELGELDGLRESQRILQTLIGNLPGVAYRCRSDLSWRLELVSEGCLQLTGYAADDLIEGRVKMAEIIHPDDLPALRRGVAKALKRQEPYQSTYRIQTPAGQTKWVWDKGCGVYSADGEVLALEGFITDISELKCAEERIRRMAYFDELTGLPNRLSMHEALSTAIARSGDSHAPLALLHVEVDKFREINETLGYHEGDRLLQALAARLQERGGALETLARIAESSFALLLPGQDASHAMQVARNVVQTLNAPLALGELLVHSDCSVGITLFPGHGNDPDALMRRANVARYGAKQGTEKVAIYAGSLDSENTQRLSLMTDLRHAIDRDELLLLFQPKLRMGSKRVTGVEALVRWEHPERGLISPSQFITFAERAGLITKLTYWVLAAAVRESYLWHDAGRAVPIAINLSPHDIRDPQLIEQISRALQTWGGAPDWIQFELTESCIMEDLAAARQVLVRLREAGFKIFIDDFGTGYSSLSYLRKLPVDYIKIDQSFVIGLGSDKESAAIVKSIIELAHSLGIEVVAEGVESTEAMDMLSGWGCEEAQGYCISKPISGRDFQSWNRAFA